MFWRRALSIVVLVPLVLLIIYQGDWLFLLLVSAVASAMQVEYCRLARHVNGHFDSDEGPQIGPDINPVMPVGLTAAFCLLPFLARRLHAMADTQLLLLACFTFILIYVFAESILSGKVAGELATAALKLTGILIIGWGVGYHLILLRDTDEIGRQLIFLLAGTIWCSDTGAYLIGRTIGKHKLGTPISPRKTVEGTIAGLVLGTLTGLTLGAAILRDTFSLANAAFIGLILSALGQLGDLSASLVKRTAGVKDSGDIIPGHGGFLDRCDSLIFSTPVLYYYMELTRL